MGNRLLWENFWSSENPALERKTKKRSAIKKKEPAAIKRVFAGIVCFWELHVTSIWFPFRFFADWLYMLIV